MIGCPGCGANLKFNISTQLMHCDFCDNSYNPYDFDTKTKDGIEVKDFETTVFTCPECAGEINSTDNEITGFCPFCGASTIFYSRMEREERPDYIIPFKISKEDCKNAYISKANKMIFMPKELKKKEYIDSFRGIYIPYWSYDIDSNGRTCVKGEITKRRGDYIHHEHYDLTGNLNAFCHGIPHDASSSFSDDISDRIAPFNIREKQSFTAGFLSGFYADRADVSPELYKTEALNVYKDDLIGKIYNVPEFRKYSRDDDKKQNNIPMKMLPPQRSLLPVWFMSYRFKDRVIYATVNGQTGKVAADFPISVTKFLGVSAIWAAVLFMLFNLVFTFTPRVTSIITAVVAAISALLFAIEWMNIKEKDNRENDRGYITSVGKDNIKKTDMKMPWPPVLSSLAGAVISAIMFISKSIHDYLHYGAVIISAICIGYTLICLVKDYNLLATRRLPQFDRTGGDDNA